VENRRIGVGDVRSQRSAELLELRVRVVLHDRGERDQGAERVGSSGGVHRIEADDAFGSVDGADFVGGADTT
jgi:hypothetical protein